MPNSIFDFTLVKIRRIQLRWEIKNLGLLNLFYVGLAVVTFFFGYHYAQMPGRAWMILVLILASLVGIHFSRRDFPFIVRHIERPSKAIFWEYAVLYSAFNLPFLFSPHWYFIFIFWAGIFALSHIRPKNQQYTFLKKMNRVIPGKYFEAIGGLRKTFVQSIILYALALGFSWVRGIPLFFIWFLTVLFASYFAHCEPLHVLRQTEKNSTGFLWEKVGHYGICLFILYLPICLVNYIFHPEIWYLHIAAIPLQIGLLAVAIFVKYAAYRPNFSLKNNQVVVSITALAALIPFLFPIPVVFGFIYYFRAKKNLKYFLHD